MKQRNQDERTAVATPAGDAAPAGQATPAASAEAAPETPQEQPQEGAAEKDLADMFGFASRDGSESWPRENDAPDGETAGSPLPEA